MNHSRPRLKAGVDLQLHNALNEGNWPVVIRLADKRATTLNDQYYQIVKLSAECLVDDVTVRTSAVEQVISLSKGGTTVKDIEAVELLEWATRGLIPDSHFAHIFGPLRVRLVKASPKKRDLVLKSLERCLLQWDLNSAQQIAALLDRTFQQEKKYMFWNIVITHLLATSSQAPAEKKSLYGTLAQRQMERAAQTAEQKSTNGDAVTRSVQSEEEVLLLYDILQTHGSPEAFDKIIASSHLSPTAQVALGRKEPLLRVLDVYTGREEWARIVSLCRECLSQGVTTNAQGARTVVSSDWVWWKRYISAAKELSLSDITVVASARDFISEMLEITGSKSFYRRTVLLARLAADFAFADRDDEMSPTETIQVKAIVSYMEEQGSSPSCFVDVKTYFEQLNPKQMLWVAFESTPAASGVSESTERQLYRKLLSLKLRSLALSSSQLRQRVDGGMQCLVCSEKITANACGHCLDAIDFAAFLKEVESRLGSKSSSLKAEAAALAATNLINVSLGTLSWNQTLGEESLRALVQAIIMIQCVTSPSDDHRPVQLLEILLSVRLGAPRIGLELWETLGIKRTIVDSMAPVFIDRLSSVDPDILHSDAAYGWELIDMVNTHYLEALKRPMQRRFMDAMEGGNYDSVVGMPRYMDNLRNSCTRVMGIVEEARMVRLVGHGPSGLLNDKILEEVNDVTQLHDSVDSGSFSDLLSAETCPLHERLAVGPSPSNTRSHLSLLAETYHDLVQQRPLPPGYKPSPSTQAVDQVYIMEMLGRLANSFSRFNADAKSHCTRSEHVYYQGLQILATVLPLCLEADRSRPLPQEVGPAFDALSASLTTLHSLAIPSPPRASDTVTQTVSSLASLHDLTHLRDLAIAVKLATERINEVNEQAKQRDQSGKSNLPKELVTLAKKLLGEAQGSLKRGREHVGQLRATLKSSRRLEDALSAGWVRRDDAGSAAVAAFARDDEQTRTALHRLVAAWQQTVDAWSMVKWE